MEFISKGKDLYLLIDQDDLFVKSSPVLQAIVDANTNFKTVVLHMFEQLVRNCQFVADEVELECNLALKENRMPDLDRFKIFDGKTCLENNCYTEPIDYVKYFVWAAKELKEYYLEERDTFLEVDNLPKGERKHYNKYKERQLVHSMAELISNSMDSFHIINEYCLERAGQLINEAVERNVDGKLTVPNFGSLVRMDTNDIIKSNSINSLNLQQNKEYILYTKPIENLVNCIRYEDCITDVIDNAEIFFNPVSKAIIDYSLIHSLANVKWDAINFIIRLIGSGNFKGAVISTHDTGGREEVDKIILDRDILPIIMNSEPVSKKLSENFIGQTFHEYPHDANRRGRSSKILRACELLDVDPDQLVLLDDSKDNCRDCKNRGGLEILVRPETDSEMINDQMEETGFNRITAFDDEAYEYVCDLCSKHKEKIKRM